MDWKRKFTLNLINGKHFGRANAAGYWVTETQHSVFYFSVTTSKHPHTQARTYTHICMHAHTQAQQVLENLLQVFSICVSWFVLGPGMRTPRPTSFFPAIRLFFLVLLCSCFCTNFLAYKNTLSFSCETNMTMHFCQGVCLNSPQSRKIEIFSDDPDV